MNLTKSTVVKSTRLPLIRTSLASTFSVDHVLHSCLQLIILYCYNHQHRYLWYKFNLALFFCFVAKYKGKKNVFSSLYSKPFNIWTQFLGATIFNTHSACTKFQMNWNRKKQFEEGIQNLWINCLKSKYHVKQTLIYLEYQYVAFDWFNHDCHLNF